MNHKAAAVCALVMLSSPAVAQGWGPYGPGGYGPGYGPGGFGPVGYPQIQASLRAHGLRPTSPPMLTGRHVVIRAIDRDGIPVRVLLSARFGDVVDVRPMPSAQVAGIFEPRPFRPYMVYPERRYPALEHRAARPDLMSEPPESMPPANPHVIEAPPNGRAAVPNAAPRTAAIPPKGTPTPRPRPPAAGTTAAVTPAPAATDTKPATAPAPAPAAKPAPSASEPPKPAPAAAASALKTPDAPAITGSTPPPSGRHSFPPTTTLE